MHISHILRTNFQTQTKFKFFKSAEYYAVCICRFRVALLLMTLRFNFLISRRNFFIYF